MPRVKKDKILFQQEEETINANGEVSRKERTTQILIESEPNYVKLYINMLLTFKELPTTLSPLLLELLRYMTYASSEAKYGGQIINLSAFAKQQIAEKLNMKVNTISHSLTKLCKSGILKRVGTGAYQVNPHLFGKGEWKDIKEIQGTFKLNAETCEMKTNIVSEPAETEFAHKMEINGNRYRTALF